MSLISAYVFETPVNYIFFEPSNLMLWYISKKQQVEKSLEYPLGIQNNPYILPEQDRMKIKKLLECLQRYNFTKSDENKIFNQKKTNSNSIELNDIDYLVINPSTTCNLDCWYCYCKEYRKKNQRKLSIEEIKNAVNIFLDKKKDRNNVKPLVITAFYSSEITLQFEDFLQLDRIVKEQQTILKQNIHLLIPSTNFYDPTDAFIDFINEYGFLVVSIDLSNKEQEKRILHNLARIKPNTTKSLIIPLQPYTSSLKNLYERFFEHFDEVSLRPVRIDAREKYRWDIQSISYLQKELYRFALELAELPQKDLMKFLSSLGSTDYFRRFLERVMSRTKLFTRCPAGKKAVCLSPEGKFYPCTGLMGIADFEMGELKKNIKHLKFPPLFDRLSKTEACLKCPISFWCGGHCVDWISKEYQKQNVTGFTAECYINMAFLKSAMMFVTLVSFKYPSLLQNYCKKIKKSYRLNYNLNLLEFCRFFGCSRYAET